MSRIAQLALVFASAVLVGCSSQRTALSPLSGPSAGDSAAAAYDSDPPATRSVESYAPAPVPPARDVSMIRGISFTRIFGRRKPCAEETCAADDSCTTDSGECTAESTCCAPSPICLENACGEESPCVPSTNITERYSCPRGKIIGPAVCGEEGCANKPKKCSLLDRFRNMFKCRKPVSCAAEGCVSSECAAEAGCGNDVIEQELADPFISDLPTDVESDAPAPPTEVPEVPQVPMPVEQPVAPEAPAAPAAPADDLPPELQTSAKVIVEPAMWPKLTTPAATTEIKLVRPSAWRK